MKAGSSLFPRPGKSRGLRSLVLYPEARRDESGFSKRHLSAQGFPDGTAGEGWRERRQRNPCQPGATCSMLLHHVNVLQRTSRTEKWGARARPGTRVNGVLNET